MLTLPVMRHPSITLVALLPVAAYAVELPLIVTFISALFIFETCATAQDHANRNDSRTEDFTTNITSFPPSVGSAGTYGVMAGTNFGSAQGSSVSADVQITAPVSGTIVKPGQSFSVTVTSPNSTAFTTVMVVAPDPFGFSTLQTGVPTRVSFTVPAEIACQSYAFTAVGRTASGRNVESVPILIDVERPDLPTLVSTPTSEIMMSAPGETAPLILLAKFADGIVLDVTHSSKVAYSSTNTKVATIDVNGIVTAVSPGRVFVKAAYTVAGKRIPTAIPVSVPTPTLTPSKFSVTFGSQAVGTASSSQSVTLTNMANAPIRVISLNTTGDFSESDNCRSLSPLPAGGECVVNVTFKPAAVGTRSGKLAIVNSSEIIPTTLPLSGPGIGP